MLYFLHHPAGNVVIRTNNPYIVLQYQHKGFLTTPSFDEVLAEHPEWRTKPTAPPTSAAPTKNFAAMLLGTLFGSLRATLAFVPSFSPAGVATIAPLLARTSSPTASDKTQHEEEQPSNTGPIHWLTAVERKWYWERGFKAPVGSWVMCTEGDEVFDYRLEEGVWELEAVPGYVGREGRVEDAGLERKH
jgi:hypothetical protein